MKLDVKFKELNIVSDGGYDKGYTEGYSEGETAGYNNGYSAGETAGYNNGYSEGETAGYNNGLEQGIEQGKEQGEAETLAKLEPLTVTENGLYIPEVGYNEVSVSVTSTALKGIVERTATVITAEDLAGVEKIGDYAFIWYTILTSVTFPSSVTTIGIHAFEYCRGLASITFPDSVTTIGDSAFEDCSSLVTVTIPDSVTTIGGKAFCWCRSLTSAIIEGNAVKTSGNSGVFTNTPIANGTGYIYIKPTSPDVDEATLVEQYKNATNWSVYADQIKGYSEYTEE